jgi:hypothetical protein
MLVDINLIPKSSKNVNAIKLISILMAIIFLGGILVGYYQYNQLLTQKSMLIAEFNKTVAERTSLQETPVELEKNMVDENTISKLLNEINSPNVVITPFVKQLPNQGSILALVYDHSGSVTIQTQLTSMEEIAAYISDLNAYDWIDSVGLLQVSHVEVDTNNKYFVTLEVRFFKNTITNRAGE